MPAHSENPKEAGAITDWVALIRAEYLEVPGLRLKVRDAERLWGLDAHVCEAILEALVDAGFLVRTRHHDYVRADTGR